jgi:hypothetical protein
MSEPILVSLDSTVTCPQCERVFSLREGFAQQALESLEANSQAGLHRLREQERVTAEARARQIADEKLRELAPQLEALKQQQLAEREQSVRTLAAERTQYEQRLAASQQLTRQLQAEQMTLREERQQLKDEKETLALAVQRQVDARLGEREARVRAMEQERAALREAELQKTIDDMRQKVAEAQQKAEQGSQQLQGEVLELALEAELARVFPLDAIDEVRKGARGGDVIHRVATRSGQHAGTVLWETKRAKEWGTQWCSKLKEDMRACGAEVGVLVTTSTALPAGWTANQPFGLNEDVWVTTWSAALHLAQVLRHGMLDVHRQRLATAGKGEKLEAVYDYVTSPQFVHKLKAVYGAFQRMREELEQEKNVTQQRWARRDKQLQSGLNELLGVAGDLQGLSAQPLPMLELEPERTDRG